MFRRDLSCFARVLLTLLAINIVILIVLVSYIKVYSHSLNDPNFCELYKVGLNASWPIWPYNFHNVSTKLQQEFSTTGSDDVSASSLNCGTSSSYSWPKRREEDGQNDTGTERARAKLYCDADCQRFRDLLRSWPPNRPKALIYFLIRDNETMLVQALHQLDSFFNNVYRYPVVVFLEKELKISSLRDRIRSATNSMVFFQAVAFDLRPYKGEWEIPDVACWKSIGYRHMCRFQAKGVYEEPILEGVDYVWRLDDDSEILAPIRYDVFEFMRSRDLSYGYYLRITDNEKCVAYLWETTCRYVSEEHLRTEFFSQWKPTYMFYNNFEISALSLWRSCAYQKYVDYIDRLGGIYYYRWGDAPIKSLALSLMTPWNKIHQFNDIKYRHQGM